MAFKLKNPPFKKISKKSLSKVSTQLKKASKLHADQAAKIDKTGTAKNTIITKGYADFTAQTNTSTYPRGKLDFNQGDYLAFMIEADSGSAEATVTLTVEFYIDDTL